MKVIKVTTKGVDLLIHYCNGVEFTHNHDSVRPAVREYSGLLAAALEEEPDRQVHIQRLTLILFDADEVRTQSVESGVFSCMHTQDKVPA